MRARPWRRSARRRARSRYAARPPAPELRGAGAELQAAAIVASEAVAVIGAPACRGRDMRPGRRRRSCAAPMPSCRRRRSMRARPWRRPARRRAEVETCGQAAGAGSCAAPGAELQAAAAIVASEAVAAIGRAGVPRPRHPAQTAGGELQPVAAIVGSEALGCGSGAPDAGARQTCRQWRRSCEEKASLRKIRHAPGLFNCKRGSAAHQC
jgi:hypothetical protein